MESLTHKTLLLHSQVSLTRLFASKNEKTTKVYHKISGLSHKLLWEIFL